MSIEHIVQHLVDIMGLLNIMVKKGDLWRENVRYAGDVLRVAAVSVTHIMLPSGSSR